MKRKEKLPELLAPAGSFDALLAAISAGADAVYIGGKSFGARAYAKNFTIEEIERAAEICHIHSLKLYAALNTLIFDKEIKEASDFALSLYRAGIDAIICADTGIISEIRHRIPDFKIHASTQMSVHNTEGAVAAANLGCERVVLARELSLENISSVTEKCPIETEIFLHGALCVCHSGQCLFSSLVGGRSGNRGECAQPCRLPYGKGYPLSLKDLSLHSHIKELINSGVSSLKIEGRMKSAEYVYRVTKIYRTLLDAEKNGDIHEEDELKKIFSRDGFTDGYFTSKTEKGMLGIRSESDKNNTRAQNVEIPPPKKIKIKAEASFRLGSPSILTLSTPSKSVTVSGATPRTAENAPLTDGGIKERLKKLGGTEFLLEDGDIDLYISENVNLSPGEINALRREAVSKLCYTGREYPDPNPTLQIPEKSRSPRITSAYFHSVERLTALLHRSPSALSGFDSVFVPLKDFARLKYSADNLGIAIPPVITDREAQQVKELISLAHTAGIRKALLQNISHDPLLKPYSFEKTGDFRLNVTNSLSMLHYRNLGINSLILSPELTLPMAKDIGGGVIVYGKIPLMLTERCFIKDNFGCEKRSGAHLTDRTGAKFPIVCEFGHRNLILNSTPTYMGDKQKELRVAGLFHHHFIFTTESAEEIEKILSAYKKEAPLPCRVRRMGKRD